MYHVSFIVIIEPMVDKDKLIFTYLQLGFKYAFSNDHSCIWVFWNLDLKVFVQCNSTQCIWMSCKHGMVNKPFMISAVYGKCSKVERTDLW